MKYVNNNEIQKAHDKTYHVIIDIEKRMIELKKELSYLETKKIEWLQRDEILKFALNKMETNQILLNLVVNKHLNEE